MKNLILLAITIVFCSCAASLRVATDYDRNASFANIETFGIYKVSADVRNISELNRNRIYNAIRTSMIQRGFIESAQPDIWINAVATIRTEESVSSTTTTSGGSWGPWGPWGVGGRYRPYFWSPTVYHTQYHVDITREGVLIIDIIDARSGHLIWQSTGKRRIDNHFRNNNEARIDQYVRDMLNDFPPR